MTDLSCIGVVNINSKSDLKLNINSELRIINNVDYYQTDVNINNICLESKDEKDTNNTNGRD